MLIQLFDLSRFFFVFFSSGESHEKMPGSCFTPKAKQLNNNNKNIHFVLTKEEKALNMLLFT